MTTPRPADQPALAAEYVADDNEVMAFTAPDLISNAHTATAELTALLRERITSVINSRCGDPGIMLSGGIDSILVAAVAADLGYSPHAVTVVTDDDADLEDLRSRDVARHLGLHHDVLDLNEDRLSGAARDCIDLLGTWELWEITSAIPIKTAFTRFAELGAGPVLTGAGSDALFMGGAALDVDPASPAGLAEFRERVTARVRANFTRQRLIPDYYERLLGDRADDFIQVFQTTPFWQFAMRLDPTLLWGSGPDGDYYDKWILRKAAIGLGVPEHLAWTTKSPLQVSSGVIGALAHSARANLAAQPGQGTYASPLNEPLEHTVVRQFLRHLQREYR
ncbi:MAG: asparagine synthase C-terminal domain-containing protein [Gordonia sp. (in: high G+C Gram-positive bacteria)]|uniref:asparagine synthase C-terminal domain-containing protein n=1 Tax=Gordonia sp. (in: high G+C Gram-positive bacteria) TaxID=84139 RepID=UPI003BB6AA80